MNKRHIFSFAYILLVAVLFSGCRISYTFSGASISPLAETFSVAYFPNNATMVAPMLSATLTDALEDKFVRQTRLSQVREGGDLAFEGEIVNYTSTPTSISGDEYAAMNRLTITVRVRFTNLLEPEYSFSDKTFSAYQDYNAQNLLNEVEGTLIPEIVDLLVEDIFNAAVSNW